MSLREASYGKPMDEVKMSFQRSVKKLFGMGLVQLVMGLTLVNVLGSSFQALVDQAFAWTELPWLGPCIQLVASAAILGVVVGVMSRPKKVSQPVIDRHPARRKGLIVMLSTGPSRAAHEAIAYHREQLEHVWVIVDDRTAEKYDALKDEFDAEGLIQPPLRVDSPFEPMAIHEAVRRVYEELRPRGWDDDDVIADITGMPSGASVGMVLACVVGDRPLEYTDAKTRIPTEVSLTQSPVVAAPGDGHDHRSG